MGDLGNMGLIGSEIQKFISELIFFCSALFKIISEQKFFISELFALISGVNILTPKL